MLLKAALVVAIILGAFWFLNQPKQAQFVSPIIQKSALVYEDPELKFKLEYPADFELINESEEQYSERTKTKYRKNFTGYVEYEPPAFVKGIVVKAKETNLTEDQFQQTPFTLWVFENPQELTGEKWYAKYWYYPFFWGVYDSRKAQIEPVDEATVSGVMAKSAVVSYSPGKPKLILLPMMGKMYLFKIMEGGENILESFKFL